MRPSVWLWRRAIKLRKAQAPTERASGEALRGVRFGYQSTTAAGRAGEVSPLVVDLGCGFGVGLLSLVQPSPAVLPSPAVQPSTAVNVLGCDACALKVGYPSPNPRPSALTLALVA